MCDVGRLGGQLYLHFAGLVLDWAEIAEQLRLDYIRVYSSPLFPPATIFAEFK